MNSLYPKLYNSSGQVLAVLDNIIKETASIKRVVNGEFTFNFSAYEKELKSEYFDPANVLVVDNQTFDIKYIEQEHETDVQYVIQCEHVNYRMEDGEENLFPSYTYTGTPTQILSNILAGTEFSVGTVEFTDAITITVNAEITRKSLIYELANTLGGEVDYTNLGFTINILASIGKNNGFQARFGKNLKGIRKIIDNRGGLKTYYSVDIIMLKNSNEYIEKELRDLEIVDIGDTIQLIDPVIGLDLQNRILSMEYNPIFEVNTKLEIANNIELITAKIKQIETSTVHKNKIYNGVHISAEDGFVAERSDGKAKTILNATEGISIYSDIGSGLAKNFFVGLDGRIQAKGLDIDGSGTFSGNLSAAGGTFSGTLSGVDGTFSGTLSGANGTFSGTISASTIIGSTISGSTVIAGTSSKIKIYDDDSTRFGTLEFLVGDYRQAAIWYQSTYSILHIEADGRQIDIDADYLNFNGYPIATEQWVDNNYPTKWFVDDYYSPRTHNHGNDYVKSYTGQNLSLVATETGIAVRVNGVTLGSIFYD